MVSHILHRFESSLKRQALFGVFFKTLGPGRVSQRWGSSNDLKNPNSSCCSQIFFISASIGVRHLWCEEKVWRAARKVKMRILEKLSNDNLSGVKWWQKNVNWWQLCRRQICRWQISEYLDVLLICQNISQLIRWLKPRRASYGSSGKIWRKCLILSMISLGQTTELNLTFFRRQINVMKKSCL